MRIYAHSLPLDTSAFSFGLMALILRRFIIVPVLCNPIFLPSSLSSTVIRRLPKIAKSLTACGAGVVNQLNLAKIVQSRNPKTNEVA